MLRLPNQFEPNLIHRGESAAAGGSSSTTCTCCVVSLASAPVLTSIYFASLVPRATLADGTPAFEDIASLPEETGQAPKDNSAGGGPSAPATAEKAPRSSSKLLHAMLGFFTPVLAVGAAWAGVLVDQQWIVLQGALFLLVWFAGFIMAFKYAGRSSVRGAVAGLLALIALGAAIVIEFFVWNS